MLLFEYLGIVIIGLIFGSFLGALTYRIPRKISIAQGRSFCPKCKKQISWYDNIPLVSFFILKGKCRHCRNKISKRYPLIEFFTMLTFVSIFIIYKIPYEIVANYWQNSIFYLWKDALGPFTLPYFLLISIILIAVFIIDFEKQIIPDNLIFILYFLIIGILILLHIENFYYFLVAGFASSVFLLSLVFITRGKGMGLGDVKLALPLGSILGPLYSLVWIFLAFLTGGYFGIILILARKAKLKDKVPFGPFLLIAFFITLIWGNKILSNLGIL